MDEHRKFKIAREIDTLRARQRETLGPIGKNEGRLVRSLSIAAVMNAVKAEGREVLKKDAAGYWKDMDRRYFGINEQAVRSPRVMRNRLGRVTFRKVYA